jgi:hypothetical protein
MEALKPNIVKRREQPKGKRRRKGDVYVRQGEWFFIPWQHAKIDADDVLLNATLVRGPGCRSPVLVDTRRTIKIPSGGHDDQEAIYTPKTCQT